MALIGLQALDQQLPEFGEVELVLHPWRIGCALEVADAAGLLSHDQRLKAEPLSLAAFAAASGLLLRSR